MLLEFSVQGYKTFVEKATFSMQPSSTGISDLAFSVLRDKIGRKQYTALCSSVIYGPNAAGKTNIIGAMAFLKNIVIEGHIRNRDKQTDWCNICDTRYEWIPSFQNAEVGVPVMLEISFVAQGALFRYCLLVDLGRYGQVNYHRRVAKESLFIDNARIYSREGNEVEIVAPNMLPSKKRNYYNSSAFDSGDIAQKIASQGIQDDELFLSNGFKIIYSPMIEGIIKDWFENLFYPICRWDKIKPDNAESLFIEGETTHIDPKRSEISNMLGLPNKIGFIRVKKDAPPVMASFFDKYDIILPSEWYESLGTIHLMQTIPFIYQAIKKGATLVMDELDTSIHPMLLMSLIDIFHNEFINKRKAQLIFNTHNPVFLNAQLFRRDEIKLVERDEKTGNSEIYSLASFGTSGRDGVRKGEDYLKNYFIGKYGAIKHVDFSPLFDDIFADEPAEQSESKV